jgi:nucleoside-diphosphate-sugar epimerase
VRLLVTGGSSFVGASFCIAAARDHEVIAVYNRTPVALRGIRGFQVDLGSPQAAVRLAQIQADAIVHTACKVKGTGNGNQQTDAMRLNRRMMDAVLAVGLPIVYASSTCVHWDRPSGYALGRRDDELRLRDSGVPWAVVRPCAPYGPRLARHKPAHKESFHTLAELVRKSPLVPVIGNGRYLRQPIHVDDLSAAMLSLLERGLPGAAFDAGGRDAISFRDIVATCAQYLGVRRRVLPMPKRALIKALSLSPDFEADLLDTADTDDVADPRALAEFTGRMPRSFRAGVADLYGPAR